MPANQRPELHFTSKSGYMNDPNGLFYNEKTGQYHMYFQIDPDPAHLDTFPDELQRHWGHAVSEDLICWEERDIVMEPDELGEIYSGCAVVDRQNTSGLFDESVDPRERIVFLYTSTEGFVQSLAYSTDGGNTLKKYAGNPVIANPGSIYGPGMRDPKIIRFEDRWILTVGGDANRKTTIFVSDDLIHWTFQSQMFFLDGSVVDTDCTDLFPMYVQETDETKWVFSGSSIFYIVGDLKKDAAGCYVFVPESDRIPYRNGNELYAAQSFYNTPDGRRISIHVLIEDPIPGKTWCGIQSLPYVLTLRKSAEGYRLITYPVEELERFRSQQPIFHAEKLVCSENMENPLRAFSGHLLDIELTVSSMGCQEFGILLRKSEDAHLKVFVRPADCTVTVDRAYTNRSIGKQDAQSFRSAALAEQVLHLRIILDAAAVEVFSDRGVNFMSLLYYAESGGEELSFYVKGGTCTIDSMDVYELALPVCAGT